MNFVGGLPVSFQLTLALLPVLSRSVGVWPDGTATNTLSFWPPLGMKDVVS